MRALTLRRSKTERLDSQLLAQLLRLDQIPLVYIPESRYQRLRELTRNRGRLTQALPQVQIGLRLVLARHKVLGEIGQAMTCPELITAMASKGYWSSPRGRTPAGTLYSAILRELKTKGEESRFVKTQRGKFALRGAV